MNKMLLFFIMSFSASMIEAVSVSEKVHSFFTSTTPTHITQEQAAKSMAADSTKVVSSAAKLIVGVTAVSQKDLKTVDTTEGLNDWEGKPLPIKPCVKFMNAQESLQAVDVDGKGVIIVNNVKPEDARQMFEKIRQLTECSNLKKSIEDGEYNTSPRIIRLFIHFINEMGYKDVYNSDTTFVEKNMTPVYPDNQEYMHGNKETPLGFFKRDSRDICYAFFVPGRVEFEGPAATAQKAENGAYIVLHGKELRLIQQTIFNETYVRVDGKPVSADEFAQYKPAA
jgi:hypothetical protein